MKMSNKINKKSDKKYNEKYTEEAFLRDLKKTCKPIKNYDKRVKASQKT